MQRISIIKGILKNEGIRVRNYPLYCALLSIINLHCHYHHPYTPDEIIWKYQISNTLDYSKFIRKYIKELTNEDIPDLLLKNTLCRK